ncbi:phosphotransferase family protein [Microlunatus sp. GCM10028923]|uniref:phosphotransferase family protein n=1 Tax=Microlunatus sp. GCM10028923 TaxID=3273400 RepID=UPI0036143E27
MTAVSVQAWSAVWRLPTGEGSVLIKQTTTARSTEGLATAFAAECDPGVVDHPLAVDAATGRILLRDGGPTLYEGDPDHRGVQVETITALLADYAGLQQATVGRDREAADAGIPSWDCAGAARMAGELADRLHELPASDPRWIPAAQVRLIHSAASDLDRAAERLAASPLPRCLDHGDLWPGNALPPRPGRPRYRLIDFGDAAWNHPFLSMIMMIIECRYRWSVPDLPDTLNLDHPVLHRIIDGYLSAWSDYVLIDELRRTMSDALRVAPLRRAQAWLANLAEADGEALAEHGQLPWLWLRDVTVPVSGLVRTG